MLSMSNCSCLLLHIHDTNLRFALYLGLLVDSDSVASASTLVLIASAALACCLSAAEMTLLQDSTFASFFGTPAHASRVLRMPFFAYANNASDHQFQEIAKSVNTLADPELLGSQHYCLASTSSVSLVSFGLGAA